MSDIEVNGIITSSMQVGDYDRRIVILTKELGRINAFAKYARTPKSPMQGCTREFICGKFRLYRGQSSYTVTEINVNNYFVGIYEDIVKTTYGLYFLEIINYYTRENNNEIESLLLIYRALQALEEVKYSFEFIKAVFQFKMLVIQGEYPLLTRFMDTKNPVDKRANYYLSIEKNGLVESGDVSISSSVIYAMLYIIKVKSNNTYSFKLKEEIEKEFIDIVDRYFSAKVDVKFKSLEALEWISDINNMKKMLKK